MKSDKSYQWNAADYAQHSSAQLKWAEELIKKLNLRGDEMVLDIGCGDGKITAGIAEMLPDGRVLGIDSSREMVSLASRSYPEKTFPNLSFQMLDVRDLDHDNRYDVVFSNAVLHWCLDHQPILRRIKTSLKPRGRMLLQMGGKGNAQDILNILDELQLLDKWSSFFVDFSFPYGFYDAELYRQWLEEAGLEVRRVNLIPKVMQQTGREGLSGWIRTTWLPYLDRVPSVLQEDFIEEIVNRYLDLFPADSMGAIHVKMVRLEAEAVCPG